MQIFDLKLNGVKLIVPDIYNDERGYFFESFNYEKYKNNDIDNEWIQDNESKSTYGVLRGLHYQLPPYTQAKLVRVIKGKVLDVVVDIRKNSNTFGRHISVELSEDNKYQLYIPRGFAHGFVVLSEEAIFSYKCDNIYMKSHEAGILYNDKELNIDWKIDLSKVIISDKDKNNKLLKEIELL